MRVSSFSRHNFKRPIYRARNEASQLFGKKCCSGVLLTNAPQNMTTTVKEATHTVDQSESCSHFSATGKAGLEGFAVGAADGIAVMLRTGPSTGSVPTFLMTFQHKNAEAADTTK